MAAVAAIDVGALGLDAGEDRHLLELLGERVPVVLDDTYEITYVVTMPTTTASDARANLYRLIDAAAESHQPVRITGKRHNAILLSEEDWESMQETLYLLSIPGMRESIKASLDTPIEECHAELDW